MDAEILSLIARRNEIASEIGLTKRKEGARIRDAVRERSVIRSMEKRAKELGVDEDLAKQLTRMLINDSVRVQEQVASGSLGGKEVLVVGGSGKMGEWMCRFMSNRGAEVKTWDPRGRLPGYAGVKSLARAAKTADIVVVASPLGAAPEELRDVLDASPQGLVFDLCSVKAHISSALLKAAADGIRITSIHPMFGPRAPSPNGLNVLVCDCGCEEANGEAAAIFSGAGAKTTTLRLKDHDELMSFALGLPHVSALLFALTAKASRHDLEELTEVRGTSFLKLATLAKEVSGESRRVYHDIQALNPNTRHMFEAMERTLDELKRASMETDPKSFGSLMESVKGYMEE